MPNPAASTFRDSFATSGISGCWIVGTPDSGPALAGMTGDGSTGVLFHAGEGFRGSLATQDRYVLTDDAISIHLSGLARWLPPAPLGATTSTNIAFSVSQPGPPAYLVLFQLVFGWIVGQSEPYGTLSCQGDAGSVDLDWAGETWFRFRHVSDGPFGTLYWDTSPDGVTWTARYSEDATGLTNLRAEVHAYDLHADLTWWTYNGGGTPNCPTVPYVPAGGTPRATCYLLS